MREVTLQAEMRTAAGKGNGALRRAGMVPGIYYMRGESNIPIAIAEKVLTPLIQTAETHLINLKLNNGDSRSCILRDVQFDPLTDRALHVDLQGLREDEEISMEVPVIVTGTTPVGVRDGGILQQFIRTIEVLCLPRYIPDHIEVNPEELKINHFIHVSDLKLENVKILDDAETAIVGVIPPTIEKEETPAVPGAEETVEPEVIGKGKKPEEGEEGEPSAEKKEKEKAEAAPAPAPKEEKKK